MTILRFIRAAFIFARYQAWVNAPEWTKADAEGLAQYFSTPSGAKLKLVLVNLVLRQQASALSKTSGLEYEAGFATGQKAAVAALESLLPASPIPEEGDPDADPSLNQEASIHG